MSEPFRIDENYWAFLGQILSFQREHNYKSMLDACEKSLCYVKDMIRGEKKEFGKFHPLSIPAIEVGARYWAAQEDWEKISLVEKTIQENREIEEYYDGFVEFVKQDLVLASKIKNYLDENPGVVQNKLGKLLDESGHDTARLIKTLENLGEIRREKYGKTYRIYLVSETREE